MASIRVSRSLVVLLCCAWAVACEQKQALPASSEAVALARDYFPELAARRGASKVFSASEVPLSVEDARALTSRLSGDGALELTTRGMTFRIEQSLGADDSAAPRREDSVVFSGERHFWFPVGDFVDLRQGWRGSRIEEAWVVDGSEPVHRAEYQVTLPPWVSQLHDAGEYVEFLDADGMPVLRFHPSEVRDARGQARRGRVVLSGVSRSSRANVFQAEGLRVGLATEVSLEGLEAPMVVDPGWSSTARMATARSQHAALLQADGSVLVAGGVNRLGFVGTAERFDVERGTWSSAGAMGFQGNTTLGVMLPTGRSLFIGDGSATGALHDAATNTWSATGPMSAARTVASATVLRSGEVLVAGGANLATAELYDATSNTFTPTGSLSVVHRGHVAVLLRDGRVLVVSGSAQGGGDTPQVEAYDPTSRTWTQMAALLVPRHYATGTLLPDGRVLLAGGFTSAGAITHSELYDPVANTWTATGALNHPRNGHTATLLPSGKVLVTGGSDTARTPQPASELYDPATGTWSLAGALSVGRENATATLLTTGQVLVAGGHNVSGASAFYSDVDVYEASSDRWSPAGNLTRARGDAASVVLPSGEVLVVGGGDAAGAVADAERYSRASNTWAPTASLVTARSRPTVTLLPSGRVLVAGGVGSGGPLASAEQYIASANGWTLVGSMTTARDGHTATLIGPGQVFVVGGTTTGAAEVYDSVGQIWSAVASSPTSRSAHAAVRLNDGRVLVVGGRDGGTVLASAELYDPASNTWASAASLSQGRASFTLTLMPSGRVLAVAGRTLGGELASAELYDPVTNTWTPAGTLATARAFHSAVLLPSGRVLVAGGEGPAGTSLATAEVYDSTTNTWKDVTALAAPRARFTLDVLPTGEVLAASGDGSAGARLASAELFDATGAQPSIRPVVTGPDTMMQGCPVRVTGTQFRGVSGAGSGDYRDSATDFPVVRMKAVEGGRLWVLPGTEMSATGVTVTIPASMSLGAHVLSVFANAVDGGRMVTVQSNTAPVARDQSVSTAFGAPLDITLAATDVDVGPPLSYVIVTPPTHGTLSGTPPAVTYTPNAGYSGPDSFTYRARDCGLDSNVATVSINVAVSSPPVITCPADVQVEATGASGATVTYPPATATDDTTPNPTVTYSHSSGITLPLGETVVTATAEDADGAQASCTFRVTVRDTTPPPLTCPASVRVPEDEGGGAVVTYTLPESVDSVSGPATVMVTPASGTRFPSGQTRVVVTATDTAGNSARCEFDVVVQARVVSIAGGGCQSSGGGGELAWVGGLVLAVLWAGRRRGKERPFRNGVRMGGLVGVLVATSAAGQTLSSPLVAFDAERLRLSAAATDSLMVDTGRVLSEGGYRLSLLAGYERGILILEGTDGSSRSILHYRTSTWLQGAWSPVDRLELSARLPVILSQGGHGAGMYVGVSEPASSGLGTPEVGARYALMRREDGAPLSLAVGLDVGLPGGRASAFGRQEGWAGLQFAPRVSLGREVGMFALGASVGARVRSKEVEPGRDVGTELEQSVVVATRGKGLRGELALQVAESLVHPDVAVELLGGVRLPIGSGFELNALAGHGFTDIPGTPSWRVGAGIAWAHEPEQRPNEDRDGDSVPDKKDRCPSEAGVPENDGCPDQDSDGDGVVDRLDRCPNEAGSAESQGCPEPDEDGDGVPDAKDQCPKEKGTAENQGCPAVKDSDSDGVPDSEDQCPKEKGTAENQGCPAVKDSDGDGVPDSEDKCPKEKGTAENQGCPEPVKSAVPEEKLSLSGRRVTFPVGLSVIEGEGSRVLDEVVEMLKARPEVAIRIEGHTDNTGPETLNRELSQSRAEAVRSYLIQRGIDGSRLEARGYGPSRPVASNDTPEGRSENRRVDFVIKR
ncbi:kelch repeat-containing protein [Myxococcus stipitatus]|uniref:kelch repeat-containing protein n=1 Tax=Myxococcus stipitatus TaxID=83455 RepID=UPI0030CBCDC1